MKWAEGANHFSATLYRNNISNLIDWQGNTGTCPGNSGPYPGCYANVGKARYEGLTLGRRLPPGQREPARLARPAEPQEPRYRQATGPPCPATRRAGCRCTPGRLDAGGQAQVSGRRYDTNANTTELGGYTLLNLYASTRLARDQVVVRPGQPGRQGL